MAPTTLLKAGDKYEVFEVLSVEVTSKPRTVTYICRCICGRVVAIRSRNLGGVKSCGCLPRFGPRPSTYDLVDGKLVARHESILNRFIPSDN